MNKLFFTLLLLTVCFWATAQPAPAPYGPLPSTRQLRWQETEMYCLIHYGVDTYTNKEWGYGDEDPNIFQPANLVVATLWNPWSNEYGPRGFYLSTSTDLVNWTKPTRVATLEQFLAQEPAGSWSYAYFSLIDPAAPDLNFSVIGGHPYLYYVRFDNNSGDRVLFRQGITLTQQ